MMGVSDGRKSFPIGLAILIQYRSVTTHPASQPASHPASHVAVAITLNAKASSLIITTTSISNTLNKSHKGVCCDTNTMAYTHLSIRTKERTEHLDIFLFFRPSRNGVLFPMFCLLVEGECQILVF